MKSDTGTGNDGHAVNGRTTSTSTSAGEGKSRGSATGSGSSTPSWMGKRVGRFRLVGLLGQGAMGRVFRAEDTMLRRQVALKVLPKTVKRGQRTVEAERLIREARAAATLEHPNAVQVFEVNEVGGVYYIAMELVEAGSLRDLVEGHGPIDYVRACQLAAEAADALAHAHVMGIVHRDVKPANLLLSRTGRLKVADFGLARVEDPSDLSSFLAESVGTPQFVAPEIMQGVAATAKSDLYSLGATLWYLLTGKPPFEAGTTEELLHKHVNAPLPNLKKLRPDLPDGLVRAITTALAKDPTRRHGTTEQFASALRVHTIPVGASTQNLGYVPTPAPAPAEEQRTAKAESRRWLIPAVSVGGAAVAAAVIVGVLVFRGGEPNRTVAAGTAPAAPERRQQSAVVKQAPTEAAPAPAHDPMFDAPEATTSSSTQAPVQAAVASTGSLRRPAAGEAADPTRKSAPSLSSPADKGVVTMVQEVKGHMSADGEWPVLLVRPVASPDAWWIQPPVAEVVGGAFTGLIHCGDANTPNGTQFHVVVCAAPGKESAAKYKDGTTFKAIPPDLKASKPITVYRDAGKTVNLMPLIDPAAASVAGSWRFENGDLVSDDGKPATLQIPYTPPAEYDFRIEFTPTADDNTVHQHLYKAPYAFTWAMGTKHDCGFEFVDGKHVWDSPFKNTDRLQPNQRHTAVVHLREGRVQAFLNGKMVVDATTNYSNFTKNSEFAQPDPTRLALGSFHAPVRFHKVEVIEVTRAPK